MIFLKTLHQSYIQTPSLAYIIMLIFLLTLLKDIKRCQISGHRSSSENKGHWQVHVGYLQSLMSDTPPSYIVKCKKALVVLNIFPCEFYVASHRLKCRCCSWPWCRPHIWTPRSHQTRYHLCSMWEWFLTVHFSSLTVVWLWLLSCMVWVVSSGLIHSVTATDYCYYLDFHKIPNPSWQSGVWCNCVDIFKGQILHHRDAWWTWAKLLAFWICVFRSKTFESSLMDVFWKTNELLKRNVSSERSR